MRRSGRVLRRHGVLSIMGLFVSIATSAQTPSPPPPAPSQQLERVEITGSANVDDRKDATAAKFVVTREDLSRFGDTNLADALRRVPGITISGSAGQTREIRLRGLGGGYTQILVNGEPVAAGFSIDSISPELIERIEVIRSPTADSSTQSIAGSINIILRRAVRAGQRDIKLGASTYNGLGSSSATGQYGDRNGTLSYSISGSLNYERDRWPSTTELRASDGSGAPLFARITKSLEQGKRFTLGLTPRINWKPSDTQALNVDGLLQGQRFDYNGEEVRATSFGVEPTFARNTVRIVNDEVQARLSANWKSPISESGRLDLKLTASVNRRDADGELDGFSANSTQLLFRTVNSQLQDSSVALTGKYSLDLGQTHTFGAGWDAQFGQRSEDRIQHETSSVGFPTLNLVEDYDATVNRLAFYAQDEWAVTSRFSAYFGLRWEGLETRTRGNTLTPVHNRSSVFSPTMQLLWKVPDSKADRVRMVIARTYKAPSTRELIPRRWVVNDNSATSPNFQGNPALVPELAWGLDVGYERYLPGDGFLGVNAYARQIEKVILRRIFQDSDGTWISTPTNSGDARVFGIELEAKVKIRSLFSDGPDVDLRSGLARNVSVVQQVPGPGNRLSQQPSLTASLGADYRPKGLPLTLGGNLTFERGDYVRTSVTQSTRSAYKRNLDLYALWTIDKTTRLRLTFSNLLKPDSVVQNTFMDASLSQEQSVSSPSYRTTRIVLDMRL